MRAIGIIIGILAVQSIFTVMAVVLLFGNGASRDPVMETIASVGFMTTPLCITGFIAFYTAKKFGKVGFWIFCSFIAIGWGYVVYHQGFSKLVSVSEMENVSLMGAFTIAVGVGLAKALHSKT